MTERDLRLALAEGWGMSAAAMRYAEVGGGSYHWVVREEGAQRWFVTVDDLDDKPWLGDTRAAAAAGLRAAMDTAVALRRDAGLPFVAAPVPGAGGQTVRPVDARYAVAVFPFLRGRAGRFGAALPERERAVLVDMLAALHQSTPAARRAAVSRTELPRRADLEEALGELGRPWRAGPFGRAGPRAAGRCGTADPGTPGGLRPAGRGGPGRRAGDHPRGAAPRQRAAGWPGPDPGRLGYGRARAAGAGPVAGDRRDGPRDAALHPADRPRGRPRAGGVLPAALGAG